MGLGYEEPELEEHGDEGAIVVLGWREDHQAGDPAGRHLAEQGLPVVVVHLTPAAVGVGYLCQVQDREEPDSSTGMRIPSGVLLLRNRCCSTWLKCGAWGLGCCSSNCFGTSLS